MKKYSDHPWLTPWEQKEIIEKLIRFNVDLIKWDNNGTLPLKGGGKTDIYINLRNARNCPPAIEFLAKIYRTALLRLNINRFVEIPDSVSCFAGHLSILTSIPYLTIREQAKEGRVTKAKIIGQAKYGESVAIIDDVITDGESKIEPIKECEKMHLSLAPLIVLVDRQQGWKKNFQEKNIDIDVWAGMTLHTIRRFLIENNLMRKFDLKMEEKNPLVIALDNKDWEEILPIIDPLRTTGCILKVNDLFFEKGMDLISDLKIYGRPLIDFKGHDIPNTVGNACRKLKKYQPWGVTIHASGHDEMIKAAVSEFRGTPTKIFAVTLLTSLKEGCEEVYVRRPLDEVVVLAKIAKRSGAHGVVCAAEEVPEIKKETTCKGLEFLTPALRSPKTKIASDDQARISTLKGAKAAGADWLVVGRQITTNEDPIAEVKRVLKEELKVL